MGNEVSGVKKMYECKEFFKGLYLDCLLENSFEKSIFESTSCARYEIFCETLKFVYGQEFEHVKLNWSKEALREFYSQNMNNSKEERSLTEFQLPNLLSPFEKLTEITPMGIVGNNEGVSHYPLYAVADSDPLDHGIIGQCFAKLAAYELLEEKKLLLILPCREGLIDTEIDLIRQGCVRNDVEEAQYEKH